MIADLFTIENNKLALHQSIFIVPEFKLLWDDKQDLDYFKAIHLMYHPRSEYANLTPEKRQEIIKEELSNVDFTDAYYELASQKYQELVVTPSTRFFNSQRTLIEKLTNYCETVEITDNKDGNLAHIMRILKEGENHLKAYRAVETAYLEELISSKGNAETGYDETIDEDNDW